MCILRYTIQKNQKSIHDTIHILTTMATPCYFIYYIYIYIYSPLSSPATLPRLSFFSTFPSFASISLTVTTIPLSLSTSCHAVDASRTYQTIGAAYLTLWILSWFWSFFLWWFWVDLTLGFWWFWVDLILGFLDWWWLVDFVLFL